MEQAPIYPKDKVHSGEIKFFDQHTGWGFIAVDGGRKDVFLHRKMIEFPIEQLKPGLRLRFNITETTAGKPCAFEVSKEARNG